MKGNSRADFAAACAMIGVFGAAFLVMGLVPMPLLWYHPLDRAFLLEKKPHGLAMDFYGRTLCACLAAGIAFFTARRSGRNLGELPRERAWLWLGWAFLFVFLAMALMGYQLWPRPAQPLPIPRWYHPL